MSYLTTKTQYITVDGNKIAYRELSKGKSKLPLLMLVHLAATLDNWDPKLLDLIAEKHHVIVVDLPGVGASQGKVAPTIPGMAEQTIAFIQALGYDKINLLGLSMGGMIAQEMIRIQPDLVNRLILAGTGPRGGGGVEARPRRRAASAPRWSPEGLGGGGGEGVDVAAFLEVDNAKGDL